MYYFALNLVPKLNRLNPRNQSRAQIHILNFLAATQAGPVFSRTQSQQTTGFQPIHPSYHQHGSEQESAPVCHQFH